jgi:hypothetical protein
MLIRQILREVIFNPTMRGRLDSRFWVEGYGSLTKFGKVTVTDVAPAVGMSMFENGVIIG